jgi:hypothetical protein
MKVALVSCPQYGVLHQPLSLAYLSAFLNNRGHEVLSLDFSIDFFNELTEESRIIHWDLSKPTPWWDKSLIKDIIGEERIARRVETVL